MAVADLYQGKLYLNWARRLFVNKELIPEKHRVLAYYRHYAIDLTKKTFEEAVYQCQKALERNPRDVIANIVLADYCRRDYVYSFNLINNSLEEGRKAAETAISLQADSQEAHFVLGQILFCQNDWPRSMSQFNLARDISQSHAIIEHGAGFHFCLMGYWEEGLKLINKSMALSSSYPSWFLIAPFLDHYRQGRYQEALSVALKVNTPNLYYGSIIRCAVYGKLGETGEAKKELQDLLKYAPNFKETGKDLLYRFLGSEELANRVWQGIKKAF